MTRRSAGALALVVGALVATVVVVALVRRSEPSARPEARTAPTSTGGVRPAQITITNAAIAHRDLATGETRRLLPGAVSAAAFSPDGTAIAYIASTDQRCRLGVADLITLRTHDIATCVTQSARLVTTRPTSIGGVVYATTTLGGVAWSPDSKRVVFTCDPGAGGLFDGGLCLIDRDGSRQLKVGAGLAPAFSPNGRRLAVLRDPAAVPGSLPVAFFTGHRLQLWVMAADGTGARVLAAQIEDCCTHVVPTLGWAADGRSIAVTARHRYVIDVADGSFPEPLGDLGSDSPELRFPPSVTRRVGT